VIHIGIDPGVQTGYAAWDAVAGQFAAIRTLAIHEAMAYVYEVHRSGMLHSVTFEDARMRKFFEAADARQAKSGAGIREGIGSIKRDCSIWADYLGAYGIPYKSVAPSAGSTKWSAEYFQRVTGWAGRTSNHARDAAVLVLGRK
jgi:hypothetical protein